MTIPGSAASARQRSQPFCDYCGLRLPILMAPMADVCPPSLAIAVANADGTGAMHALMTQTAGIADWVAQFRGRTNGTLQLTMWTPEPHSSRRGTSLVPVPLC